jgi:hypothetical protein
MARKPFNYAGWIARAVVKGDLAGQLADSVDTLRYIAKMKREAIDFGEVNGVTECDRLTRHNLTMARMLASAIDAQ